MKSKEGDTAPNYTADTNADLTGATVRIRVMEASTMTPVIDRAATVTDALNGIVDGGNPFGVEGAYRWHVIVTFAGGEIQTFPQGSYLEHVVLPAIPVPPP